MNILRTIYCLLLSLLTYSLDPVQKQTRRGCCIHQLLRGLRQWLWIHIPFLSQHLSRHIFSLEKKFRETTTMTKHQCWCLQRRQVERVVECKVGDLLWVHPWHWRRTRGYSPSCASLPHSPGYANLLCYSAEPRKCWRSRRRHWPPLEVPEGREKLKPTENKL